MAACSVSAATTGRAQDGPRSFLRVEAGRADIHRSSSTGVMFTLRLARRIDRGGIARLEVGASYSAADEGYLTLEMGGELRPFTSGPLTPVVGVGIGLLTEPEFTGELVRGTLALEIQVSPRTAVRLGAQVGQHGGARGPNAYFGAVEVRRRVR